LHSRPTPHDARKGRHYYTRFGSLRSQSHHLQTSEATLTPCIVVTPLAGVMGGGRPLYKTMKRTPYSQGFLPLALLPVILTRG